MNQGRRPKTVLSTLEEVANPRHTALLVIDVQNDCCASGGAFGERGADLSLYEGMIPRLANLVKRAKLAGVLTIFIQATTLPGGLSQSPAQLLFERRLRASYPADDDLPFVFCVPGTWGHEFVDSLDPSMADIVIRKHRSSAFVGTELDLVLRSNAIKTIVATGCTTEGCVDSTIRDAGFLDYYPVAVEDCIASDNKELHDAAILILSAYRAWMTSSNQLMDVWSRSADESLISS